MPTDRTPTNGRTGGWVKLYRKLTDWEWYQDSYMVHLFIHLLLMATKEPRRWKGIPIERGQYITTQRTLADATGISQPTVHRCLKRLVECGAIVVQVNQRKTIVTICNYDSYQEIKDSSESKMNQKRIKRESKTNHITRKKRSKEENTEREKRVRENSSGNFEAENNRYRVELANDANFLTTAADNLHTTERDILNYLAAFTAEVNAKKHHHADYAAYCEHFYNWLRRQTEKQSRKANGKTSSPLTAAVAADRARYGLDPE